MVLQDLEAVALEPGDLILHPVDLGVVSGTLENGGILLDGIDALPFASLCECDGVAPSAGKAIHQDTAPIWGSLGEICCDFAI